MGGGDGVLDVSVGIGEVMADAFRESDAEFVSGTEGDEGGEELQGGLELERVFRREAGCRVLGLQSAQAVFQRTTLPGHAVSACFPK